MKINGIGFVLILISLVFTSISPAQVSNSPELAGEWTNIDPATRGLTSIVISRGETGWTIEAWGRCHPTDCRWGTTLLEPVGNSVADRAFNRGFAIWDAGFATKYVSFNLCEGRLVAETTTIFKDRSKRSHFRNVAVFRRSEL